MIIRCFNSAARLPETLRHLALQKQDDPCPWEVLIVVDDGTTDDTREVVESFQPEFARDQLRYIYEPKRGHSDARIRGATESRYEYLCYVDDDNWVAPDWVATIHRSFANHPEAVALGGRGEAVFEAGAGPVWFSRVEKAYAVGAQFEKPGDVTDMPAGLWGAGFCIRKSFFLSLLKAGFVFTCTPEKLGDRLFELVRARPCEDTELSYVIRAIGGRIFYVPELWYKHFMPADRMNWQRLRKMIGEQGRSGILVQNFRTATEPGISSGKAKRERVWLYQVARILRRMAGVVRQEPLSVISDAEGSLMRLHADSMIGQLGMLWRMKSKYGQLFDTNRVSVARLQASLQLLNGGKGAGRTPLAAPEN